MRIAVLVLALALGAAGCKSSEPERQEPPKASTYDGEGPPKIKFKNESPTGTTASAGPGFFDYVAVPFENIVYIPWKLLGGGGKGVSDGVSAGFAKDRMPILGVLFLPVNIVAGFVTGAVETVAMSPVFVGPSDSFGHAMAQPTRHATAIWWYE